MTLPDESAPWVIRTDFSRDDQWAAICDLIAAPQKLVLEPQKLAALPPRYARMEFFAHVKFVVDEKYRDRAPYELVLSLPDDYPGMFCFVVDQECVENREHPILVVGFYPSDHKSYDRLPRDTPVGDIATFRALPSQIQSIQNNLSIANMGFEEFANSIDEDGVFRGFAH